MTEPFLSAQWMDEFLDRVSVDPELQSAGRRSKFSFLWASRDHRWLLHFSRGSVQEARGLLTVDDSWDFSLEAPPEVWEKFLAPTPLPLYHDLFAMWARVPEFRLDGSRLKFMQNARVVRRLMELARGTAPDDPGGHGSDEAGDVMGLEPIVGRYLWVPFGGERFRIYFEEAGSGHPLLLLHTAGSDSRQFMHMFNDQAYLRNWRLVAFDMPYHGRSMPPDGWWKRSYHLTTDFYAGLIAAFVEALGLERPVVMGCSMGGQIVLELAYRFAERFAAVIGCEASDHVEGRNLQWTSHPQVNASDAVPTWIYGLMSPKSPLSRRREVWWEYSQSGLGVFNGDVDFYSGDWDARNRVAEIDTVQCPVYLLTGSYDYSCTPATTQDTASRIKDAQVTIMDGLGHFPMAENPALFKRYLLPILQSIRAMLRLD